MCDEKLVVVAFPRFYKSVRGFLLDCLSEFRKELTEPLKWPKQAFYEVSFSGTGSGTGIVEREVPAQIVSSFWETRLVTLDSYRKAIEEVNELKAQGRAVGQLFLDAGISYIYPIVANYISRSRSLAFIDTTFNQVYQEVEEYLSAERVSVRLYIQLLDLTGSMPEVSLSLNHRILRLDEESAKSLWGLAFSAETPVTPFMDWYRPKDTPMPGEFVMEVTFQYPKNQANQLSVLLDKHIRSSILAFRLAEAGSGSLKFIAYQYIRFSPNIGRFGFRQPFLGGKFSYNLDTVIADRLRKSWPECNALAFELEAENEKVPSYLRTAIRRFASSFDKATEDDRLIDYVISLEALYGERNEAISFRIPLLAATALGVTPDERQEVFDLLREAYRRRSDLAHGSEGLGKEIKLKGKALSVQEFMLKVQSSLLSSIRLFATVRKKHSLHKEQFLKVIDAAVVTQDRSNFDRLL